MFQKLRGLRRQSNIMGAQGCKIEIWKVRKANGHDGLDWIGLDWIGLRASKWSELSCHVV